MTTIASVRTARWWGHWRKPCGSACAALLLAAVGSAQGQIDPTGEGQSPNEPIPTGPAGGSYPGPGDTVPPGTTGGTGGGPSTPGGGPGTPAPGNPFTPSGPTNGPVGYPVPTPAATPTISILDLGPDTATWEIWWNLNRDRFLAIKRSIYAGDAAAGSGGTGLERRRPDPRIVADRVIPALSRVLEKETDPALIAEALIAIARADAGRGLDDPTSTRVLERLSAALSHKQLSVVESAVMALGARGSSRSMPILAAIVEDSAAGRAALARPSVPTRVRAIAALSLGLVGQRGRVDAQRYAAHVLARPLQAKEHVPQDLAGACAAALGLVDLGGPVASDQDAPAASSAASLVHFLQGLADESDRDQLVRGQAVASVGRIAAHAPESVRAAAIVWAVRVATDSARPTPVRQGAAIALGRAARPTDAAHDRAARAALAAMARDTDRLARGLAWVARAEIGARAREEGEKSAALEIQAGLLADFVDAKSSALGFVGLAIGVLAHDSALVAAADGNRALKDNWSRARSPSDASAIGLALGLRFDITAAPLLAERFPREGDAQARAALALGLGMTGSTAVLNGLKTASAPDNHPLVIRDSAIARALLGDRTAAAEMAAMLAGTKSLLAADYASDALAAMGDGTVLDGLLALVADASTPTGRKSRIVRALGAVADASLLPWNEPLRADGHYGAAFEAWNAVVIR